MGAWATSNKLLLISMPPLNMTKIALMHIRGEAEYIRISD